MEKFSSSQIALIASFASVISAICVFISVLGIKAWKLLHDFFLDFISKIFTEKRISVYFFNKARNINNENDVQFEITPQLTIKNNLFNKEYILFGIKLFANCGNKEQGVNKWVITNDKGSKLEFPFMIMPQETFLFKIEPRIIGCTLKDSLQINKNIYLQKPGLVLMLNFQKEEFNYQINDYKKNQFLKKKN